MVYRYDSDDIGMRNVAIVALTDAGRRVDEVAAVFGLTATYVSMLRGRARTAGSAGLVRRRGRPPKLTDRQVTQARDWSAQGWTQKAIADRLGVAPSVISELLARFGPASVQQALPEPAEAPAQEPVEEPVLVGPTGAASVAPDAFAGSSRIGAGTGACGTPARCCCMRTCTGSVPRRSSAP